MLIARIGTERLAILINEMDPDDRTALLEEIPAEVANRLVALLTPAERSITQTILNYPEVGILGVYKISDKAVVRDGEIVIRKMCNLSITLDHRIVDGATAAYFMNEMIRLLENPGLMLVEGV